MEKEREDMKRVQEEPDDALAKALEAALPDNLGLNSAEAMSDEERAFCTNEINRQRYRNYRLTFGRCVPVARQTL